MNSDTNISSVVSITLFFHLLVFSVKNRGGICIWAASYPGNIACVRPGVNSGSVSRGSGVKLIVVDFLGGNNDEQITALSWIITNHPPHMGAHHSQYGMLLKEWVHLYEEDSGAFHYLNGLRLFLFCKMGWNVLFVGNKHMDIRSCPMYDLSNISTNDSQLVEV
ncbi:hypothetical protein LXL04_038553 [Taraxacum kok-saghyz]